MFIYVDIAKNGTIVFLSIRGPSKKLMVSIKKLDQFIALRANPEQRTESLQADKGADPFNEKKKINK